MRAIRLLYALVPAAVILDLAGAAPALVFAVSALATVPAAAEMGEATEQLAARAGPGVGGLVNVTFGNAPELIIAVFALADGLQEVVKASLVGSIIGNSLLVLGAAMLAGGWNRPNQRIQRTVAGALSGMLVLTVIALSFPSVLQLARGLPLPGPETVRMPVDSDLEGVTIAVSLILIATYAAGLFFSLRTHRAVFNPIAEQEAAERAWPLRRSILTLAGAGAVVAGMSDILVGSIQHAANDVGLSQFFVGAFVVAIIGNAAEHYVAVAAAASDKIELSVNIAIGSSAQIGLFVAPVLFLLSFAVGPEPMGIVFNGYELAALVAAGLAGSAVVSDGESTWYEGVLLLALYAVIGVVFLPPEPPGARPRAGPAHRGVTTSDWKERPTGPWRSWRTASASPEPPPCSSVRASIPIHSPAGWRWRWICRSALMKRKSSKESEALTPLPKSAVADSRTSGPAGWPGVSSGRRRIQAEPGPSRLGSPSQRISMAVEAKLVRVESSRPKSDRTALLRPR